MKRAWLLAALLASCGGDPSKAPQHPEGSLLTSVQLAPSYASPATFRYHPPKQAGVQAERQLADGRLLLVGKRGERWLLDPRTHLLAAGSSLAPENLIAVLDGDAGYWFVGESGSSYTAPDPLGRFVRSSAPLEPLLRVSAAGHSIVGIPANRSLERSTDGAASFQRVGPAQVAFADVELASDGSGLALAVPEALYFTRDEGKTWALVPGKARGAYAVSRDRQGAVRVDTVFGAFQLADQPTRLEPAKDPAPVTSAPVASAPPRGPDAAALADGRALVLGARYLEVAAPPTRPSDYELWQGPLDGKLEATPLRELKDCRAARIAAFDRYLELACFRGPSDAGSVPVAFFRSEDAGAHFQPEPFGSFGTVAGFRFALGAGGSLLATGLCSSPGSGCSTGGIVSRREPPLDAPPSKRNPKRTKYELLASAAPTLAESGLGLAFSLDGRTAYAVGRRSKTGALAIFVSHDAGKSFDVRELDLVRADSEDEDQYWEHTQSSVRLESFAAAEDGSLSLVLADRRGRSLVVTDEQGHLVSGAKPPQDNALVSAIGMRAFALAPVSRKTWESMDGGVSWQPLPRLPVALCANESECEVKLRCAPLGCVIGNELSRIGWSGQSDDDADALPPASREASPLIERKLRAPLACAVDDAPWQTLPGVRELPGSRDAAFGKIAFVAVASDPARAAASVIHGYGGPRPHLETVSLLKPVEHANEYAVAVLDQIEGAAAVRYRLPEDAAKDNRLRNVEVAWDNALAGQVGRMRLADGGPAVPGDYQAAEGGQRADPDLLSIGEGGLYLRLHHNAGDDQDTWFFDGRTSTRIPAVKWPIPNNLRGRTEMARVDRAHTPLMLFGRGTAVARARRGASGWEFDAQTVGLPDPRPFGEALLSNIAYLGSSSGMYLQTQTIEGARASGAFFPFRAEGDVLGAAVRVPTQRQLADRPNRCGASDLSGTPRVDAGYLPGTRHPLLVTDNTEPWRLFLTAGAVLYGTPESACATAYEAEEVVIDGAVARHERVVMLLDDLEHTFLFRALVDSNSGVNAVQYRTMKCHYEADVELPSEVYRAPGTLVPRGL